MDSFNLLAFSHRDLSNQRRPSNMGTLYRKISRGVYLMILTQYFSNFLYNEYQQHMLLKGSRYMVCNQKTTKLLHCELIGV